MGNSQFLTGMISKKGRLCPFPPHVVNALRGQNFWLWIAIFPLRRRILGKGRGGVPPTTIVDQLDTVGLDEAEGSGGEEGEAEAGPSSPSGTDSLPPKATEHPTIYLTSSISSTAGEQKKKSPA